MNRSTYYTLKGPTTNGTITSPDMSAGYERGYISVIFYTDSTLSTVATPTAGTIEFKASETDQHFGTVDSGTVTASAATYPRPNFSGPIKKVQATCSGITGAGYYVATISRFGG